MNIDEKLEEFEEKFSMHDLGYWSELEEVKQFIRKALEQQKDHYEKELEIADKRWKENEKYRERYLERYAEERIEVEAEIEANIPFLRQWLNERPSRLVTDKEIEEWLFN